MKIVRTSLFERSLKKLGASAADLEKLEAEIAVNPAVGDVIQGLTRCPQSAFLDGRSRQK